VNQDKQPDHVSLSEEAKAELVDQARTAALATMRLSQSLGQAALDALSFDIDQGTFLQWAENIYLDAKKQALAIETDFLAKKDQSP
jgi:hypothetical protein